MKTFTYEHVELVRVIDADTIEVDIDMGFNLWKRNVRIRINGIDTPESRTRNKLEKQAGLKVKEYVKELLAGSPIHVVSETISGKFGNRILGDINICPGNLTPDDFTKKKLYLLSGHLIFEKYAKPYHGEKKKPWTDKELNYIIKN